MSTATATNNTEILVYGKALKKQKPMYTCDHTLVIVESPSKCPIIHNILSNDGCTAGGIIYKVIATQSFVSFSSNSPPSNIRVCVLSNIYK